MVVVYRNLSLDVVGTALTIETTVACDWKQLKAMFDAGLDTELANLLAASRPPGADTFAHFRCGKASSRGGTDRLIPPSSSMVKNMAVMFYMPKGANTGRWFEMTMPDGPSSGFNGFWTGEVDVSDVPLCVSPSYVFVPLDELYMAWTTHGQTHPITGKKTGGSAQHMPGWRAGCNGLDVRPCVAGTYGTPGPATNDSFRTVSCVVPVSHSTKPDMAAVMKLSMYVMDGTVYARVPLTKFKTGADTYALPLKNAWMGCTADFPVWNVQNLVPGGSVSGAKDAIPGCVKVGDVFVCVFVNNVLGLSVKLNGQQHFIVAPARQPYDTAAFGSSATPLSSYMEAPNVRFMPFFSKKAPVELISVQGTHELDAQVLAEDGTLRPCDFCHGTRVGHSSSLKNALKDFVKGNAVDARLVYDGMTCVLIPPPCSDIKVKLRAPQHPALPAPAAAGAAAAAAPAPASAGPRRQKRTVVAAAAAPALAVPFEANTSSSSASAMLISSQFAALAANPPSSVSRALREVASFVGGAAAAPAAAVAPVIPGIPIEVLGAAAAAPAAAAPVVPADLGADKPMSPMYGMRTGGSDIPSLFFGEDGDEEFDRATEASFKMAICCSCMLACSNIRSAWCQAPGCTSDRINVCVDCQATFVPLCTDHTAAPAAASVAVVAPVATSCCTVCHAPSGGAPLEEVRCTNELCPDTVLVCSERYCPGGQLGNPGEDLFEERLPPYCRSCWEIVVQEYHVRVANYNNEAINAETTAVNVLQSMVRRALVRAAAAAAKAEVEAERIAAAEAEEAKRVAAAAVALAVAEEAKRKAAAAEAEAARMDPCVACGDIAHHTHWCHARCGSFWRFCTPCSRATPERLCDPCKAAAAQAEEAEREAEAEAEAARKVIAEAAAAAKAAAAAAPALAPAAEAEAEAEHMEVDEGAAAVAPLAGGNKRSRVPVHPSAPFEDPPAKRRSTRLQHKEAKKLAPK